MVLLSLFNSGLSNIFSLFQAAASGEKKVFALIIVDVQNDFITGSLAVSEGKISVKLTVSLLKLICLLVIRQGY